MSSGPYQQEAVQFGDDELQVLPYMIGMKADQARQRVLEIYPDIEVEVLNTGSAYPIDFRSDRVRIFVNDDEVVVKQPTFE